MVPSPAGTAVSTGVDTGLAVARTRMIRKTSDPTVARFVGGPLDSVDATGLSGDVRTDGGFAVDLEVFHGEYVQHSVDTLLWIWVDKVKVTTQ